jgi:polyhydroxyalkanoate synthesis regulator phasin
MERISDELLRNYRKRLSEAENKTDWQIRNLADGYKLFGDTGFHHWYLQQKEWIDAGKPGNKNRNYYDWEDKNTHILFKLVDDWEKDYKDRSRIQRQKKAFIKFKNTEGTTPLELKIKGAEFAIKDAKSKDHLKNVNTIYYPKKTAKELIKDLFKIHEEDSGQLDKKTLTKIEKVVELYNETIRKFNAEESS